MKQISIMAIALALASPAFALTCQEVGDTTYCNGNGYNSTTQHVGNSDYTNENYGGHQRRTTCQTIGQFTYCN
jgi:hypothetical protein